MSQLLSRLISATGLLYLFVVLTQIVAGVYSVSGMEESGAFSLFYFVGYVWIIGWWLRSDSKQRGFKWAYDLGLFIYLVGPFLMIYYLIKSRGAKGLLIILAFIAVYLGAMFAGALAYVIFAPANWPHAF